MRTYTISFTGGASSAAQAIDFFEFTAVANRPIELVAMTVGQTTEITGTVAEDELLTMLVVRGNTTTGNGAAFTPLRGDPFDSAAGFTAKTFSTTQATAGTAVNLHVDPFNIRLGFGMIWPEGYGPRTSAESGHGLLVARLAAGASDAVTWHGTAYVREL